MKLSPIHSNRLPQRPDPAILRIIRALARQAAREDHARKTGESVPDKVNGG
jgi:hypothetical protein